MLPGTKNGEIRRGPLLFKALWHFSIKGKPPMPDPNGYAYSVRIFLSHSLNWHP